MLKIRLIASLVLCASMSATGNLHARINTQEIQHELVKASAVCCTALKNIDYSELVQGVFLIGAGSISTALAATGKGIGGVEVTRSQLVASNERGLAVYLSVTACSLYALYRGLTCCASAVGKGLQATQKDKK